MDLSCYPTIAADRIGWITEKEMIEVDRVMIEDLHIELLQMMENAGRNLARVVLDVFAPRSATVVAGSGGNGGGGLVAARHLANAGVEVVVTTSRPGDELVGAAAHQFDILRRMGVAMSEDVADTDVVIDALIGYSLRGSPSGRSAELIHAVANRTNIVALDMPSGLDATSGATPGRAVSADLTMTLALPKQGLRSAPEAGALLLADISVPRSVTSTLGPTAPHFAASPILRII